MVLRWAVFLSALALGCGGNTELPSTGPGTGGAPGDAGEDVNVIDAADAEADAAGTAGSQSLDAGMRDADEKFPWVCKDSGAKDPYKSCCAGHVCLGTCEQGTCHCGGMDGGCVLPLVCCDIGSGKGACQIFCVT